MGGNGGGIEGGRAAQGNGDDSGMESAMEGAKAMSATEGEGDAMGNPSASGAPAGSVRHSMEISSNRLGCEISLDPLDPLAPIWNQCAEHYPGADLSILKRAYDRAVIQHTGQWRRSGEPYIIHPLAVAQILADLGMSPTVVAAGMLHDTVEDTNYTIEECRKEFGYTVAGIVDGVTKVANVKKDVREAQAETIRKVVITTARDVRVLVVKLADRLHNARTWRYMPAKKAAAKAQETLDIYAPLADRLGIYAIKTELEELSFKTIEPEKYNQIVMQVQRRAGSREESLREVMARLMPALEEAGITDAYVTARPKDYYSIWRKMLVRQIDFNDIYDLMGVRIIVDTVGDCYAALGVVHQLWTPMNRIKDYISTPKPNNYQSLHTTVIGPHGKPVEFQIRTWEMHRTSEYGIAAHWKYKANGQAGRALSAPDKSDRRRESAVETQEGKDPDARPDMAVDNLEWIRQLADWSSETPDSSTFLGGLVDDLGKDRVFVFTPQGKPVALPEGATPVDFAYAIHTDLGHSTMGARVNGRLVPLDTPLNTGDRVEILKSKTPGPSRDWLDFVKSTKARSKIRQWFSKEQRSEDVNDGRDALVHEMRRRSLPVNELMSHMTLIRVAKELGCDDIDSLLFGIKNGTVTISSVISHMLQKPGEDADEEAAAPAPAAKPAIRRTHPGHKGDVSGITVDGVGGMAVKLAKCCMPIPGDDIVGFVSKMQIVSVHRSDCANFKSLSANSPDRVVNVEWSTAGGAFPAMIQVEAIDRGSLLADVTKMIADHGLNLVDGDFRTRNDRVAVERFVVETTDLRQLDLLMRDIRRIPGVYYCYRVDTQNEGDSERKRKK